MEVNKEISILSRKGSKEAFVFNEFIYKINYSVEPIRFESRPVAYIDCNRVYSYKTNRQIGTYDSSYIRDTEGYRIAEVGKTKCYALKEEPIIPSKPCLRIGSFAAKVGVPQWSKKGFLDNL